MLVLISNGQSLHKANLIHVLSVMLHSAPALRVVGDSQQQQQNQKQPQAGRRYTLFDADATPFVRLPPVRLPCRTVYDYVDDNLAEAMDDMERELREV